MDALLPPTTPENAPAGQRTHTVEPLLAAYAPAGHGWHADALLAMPTPVEYCPAAQAAHAETAVAPAVTEYRPAAQLVQLAEVAIPVPVEYCPAVQLTHAVEPPVGPKDTHAPFDRAYPELHAKGHDVGEVVPGPVNKEFKTGVHRASVVQPASQFHMPAVSEHVLTSMPTYEHPLP